MVRCHSIETRRKISEAAKRRREIVPWNKGKTADQDPRIKRTLRTQELKDAQRDRMLGRSPWNKGLTKDTDVRIARYGLMRRGIHLTNQQKRKISAARCKNFWYTHCSECGREKGRNNAPRCIWCAAKLRAKMYPNPMIGRKLTPEHKMAMRTGCEVKPTRPEKFVAGIIDFMFGRYNPYRYVGNGKFFVTCPDGTVKNPDFVALFHKCVIEVFGHYWHTVDEETKVIEKYRDAGWKCLVLWDTALGNTRDAVMKLTYPFEYDEEILSCA